MRNPRRKEKNKAPRKNNEIKGNQRKEEKARLGRKGRDPAATDLPAVISIEIARPSFNFNSFPEFTVMELRNFGNNFGLLNAHLMLGLFHMLC